MYMKHTNAYHIIYIMYTHDIYDIYDIYKCILLSLTGKQSVQL